MKTKIVFAASMCFLLFSIPFCSAIMTSTQYNLTYDGNGNLITGDGKYREYNEFNQLIRIRQGNNISGGILEEYIYHPTEDRILVKKVNFAGGPNNTDETVVYVNDNLVRRYDLQGIREINDTYYVKDQNGIAAQIVYNGTDHTPVFTQAQTSYYHNDHLGSTSVITNSSGDLVGETSYSPYGEILSGGNVSRFSYEGKEFSNYVNDYDFHFRKYNPQTGIFTQPDAVIPNVYDPQSLNRYSFERRNPYTYVDNNGKFGVAVYGSADVSAVGGGGSGGIGTLYTIDPENGIQITFLGSKSQGLSIEASGEGIGVPGGGLGANIEFFPRARRVNDVIGQSKTKGFIYSRGYGGGPFYSSDSFGLQAVAGYLFQVSSQDSTTYIAPYYLQIGGNSLFSFLPSYSSYFSSRQSIDLTQRSSTGCNPSRQSCRSSSSGSSSRSTGGTGSNGNGCDPSRQSCVSRQNPSSCDPSRQSCVGK